MRWNRILASSGLILSVHSALAAAISYCPSQSASPRRQRQIWDAFVQIFYIEGNITEAFTNYVAVDYVQHNPFIPDGRAAALAILPTIMPPPPATIVHQLFENNIGTVHHKITLPNTPIIAVADYFRYNGTCIVEHWDVIQSVPSNATNPHPLF